MFLLDIPPILSLLRYTSCQIWHFVSASSDHVKKYAQIGFVTLPFSEHYFLCSIDKKCIHNNIFKNILNFLFPGRFCLKDSSQKKWSLSFIYNNSNNLSLILKNVWHLGMLHCTQLCFLPYPCLPFLSLFLISKYFGLFFWNVNIVTW